MKAHQQNGSKTQPTANGDHKGNGKIAHLPKVTRDQINVMLRDGAPYPEIRRKLRELGNPDLNSISKQNLHNWKNAGHQHWLREQEWRDDMQQARAEALDLIAADDQSKLEQVTLKTAAMRLYQLRSSANSLRQPAPLVILVFSSRPRPAIGAATAPHRSKN